MDEEKFINISHRQKERIKNIDLILSHLFSYLKTRDLVKNSVITFASDHGPNHISKKLLNTKLREILFSS
jgi:phosphoglycerol transferase MdoB-like AlkP superfamily enzyme